MRILHVINSLHFGGAEKLLLDTLPELVKQGFRVDLMVLYNEKTPFFNKLQDEHKIKILTPPSRKSLYHPSHMFWIRRYLPTYDVVHVHLFPSLYWVGIASLFLNKKPHLVFTEHSTSNRRRSSSLFKIIDPYIYRKYDALIAISEGVRNNLASHLRVPLDTIQVIYNGIHTNTFKIAQGYTKAELTNKENTQIIIQVSNFSKQKDQETLIRAVSLLPDEVHLLLVGGGRLINEKKDLARALKVDHRVHFLGYRSDIPQLLKSSDICVLSSHYEGFGIAIVEGMAAGLPCIGSNVDGLSQIIGDAGIVYEPENHLELKNHIKKLLSNTTHYAALSQKSLERAALFDVSKMINLYVPLYRNLK